MHPDTLTDRQTNQIGGKQAARQTGQADSSPQAQAKRFSSRQKTFVPQGAGIKCNFALV